eukprot:g1690.t1
MSTIRIDRTFARHRSRGAVASMDMSDKYLLVGNSDGSITSYDVSNSKISFFIKRRTSNSNPTHHKNMVSCVQWYPVDPGIFVSSGFDGTVKVWDAERQKVVTNFGDFGFNTGIDSVAISPTSFSCMLAVAVRGSHAVHLCDVISGTQIMTLDQGGHMEDVRCVAWSPRVPYILASGGADGRVFIWDTRRSGRFGCLASLDSTKTMWNSSSSDDSSQRPKKRIRQTLEMLNVPIGNHMTGKAHRGPVDSITFTPDGNYLVSVPRDTSDSMIVWNMRNYTNTLVNFGPSFNSNQARRRRLGRGIIRPRLAITQPAGSSRTFMYVPERQGTIRVYDIHRGDVIKSLHGHMGAVNSCVYRPSHQELYSGGHDGLIVKWASNSRGGLSGGNNNDDDSDLGNEDNWSSSE